MNRLTETDILNISQSVVRAKPVTGSIVRIRLCDFMTHKLVELRAGPNVNLLMGPNGSGKSSLVCAICLGLGGKPSTLARSTSLVQYIRKGCQSAWIEVELYNRNGSNFIVKRVMSLTHTGCSSEWSLNGSTTTQKKIEELMIRLNILLDNLTQFLPQHRVQEFAKMNTSERLITTEKVLGSENLYNKHMRLIELTDSVKELDHSLKKTTETIKREQQLNKCIETDVRGFHKREKLKSSIAELEGKEAWVIYLKSRDEFSNINSELVRLTKMKKAEETKVAPLDKLVKYIDGKLNHLRIELKKIREMNATSVKRIRQKCEDENDRIESQVTEIKSALSAKEKAEEERSKRLNTAEIKLETLENELTEAKLAMESDEEFITKLTSFKKELGLVDSEICSIESDIDQKRMEICNIKKANDRLWKELRRIEEVRESRLRFLYRSKKSVYDLIHYFLKPENKTPFRGEVREPLIMHLNVNDYRYGNIVEQHIGFKQLVAFCFEDPADVKTYLKVCDSLNVRAGAIVYKLSPNFVRPPNPFSPDFMRHFKFQKTLLDLIEAPDYYIGFLCDKFRVHQALIGSNDLDTPQNIAEIMESTQLNMFYSNNLAFSITTSEYTKQRLMDTRNLQTAKIFTTAINEFEMRTIKSSVAQNDIEINNLEDSMDSQQPRLKELNTTRLELRHGIARLNESKEVIGKIQSRLNTAKRSVRMLHSEKCDLPALVNESSEQILKLRMGMLPNLQWVGLQTNGNSSASCKIALLKRQIYILQARVMNKRSELADSKKAVSELWDKVQILSEKVKSAAELAEVNKKKAQEISKLSDAPEDILSRQLTGPEIKSQLEEANCLFSLLPDRHPRFVKEYEDRLKKIEYLASQQNEIEKNVSDQKSEITRLRKEWKEPLLDLIKQVNEKFGGFFRDMRCAGEVSLMEADDPEDFQQYGLRIEVSFRSYQSLAELSGFKQSGGERAITTAFYILALQDLSSSPFKVVDEINQGMDEENECRVFNLLCRMAKGENTPQYFMITPKMLPSNVEYPSNVDIHIIFNGPYVKVPLSEDAESDFGYSDEE